MFKPFSGLAAVLLVVGALPAAADSYRASNGLIAQSPNGVDITVPFHSGAVDNAYWCAAGDYVVIAQGQSSRTRLFRATPTPRKQAQGIGFTTDPSKATPNPGLTIFGSPDGTISAGQARNMFCREDPFFGFP